MTADAGQPGILRIKRIYEPPEPTDGYRVLIDRLWPRGVSKERADLGQWLRDVGPSTALRQWFHHDPSRMDEFTARYRAELDANPAAVQVLLQLADDHPVVTLLYSAHDPKDNQAVVLRDYLTEALAREKGRPTTS